MTERFNANAQDTITVSASGGPPGTGLNLTALGVGQGSGQIATRQENNASIGFEFPIRWDDVAGTLGRLGEKKYLGEFVDDMEMRDKMVEDYLSTSVVNGVVGDSFISASTSSGVVSFGWQGPQFNIVSPVNNQVMQYSSSTGTWFNSTVVGTQGPQGAPSTVPGPTGPQGAPSTVPGPTGPQGAPGANFPGTRGENIVPIISGIGTVSHGLGYTPTAVLVNNSNIGVNGYHVGTISKNSSNFELEAFSGTSLVFGGSVQVSWIAW